MDWFISEFEESGALSVALSDCIMKKDSEVSAGSKMLEGFVAPFDAAVVARMKAHGIAAAGRVRMSEFGVPDLFGRGNGELTGAVGAVKDGLVPLALCNDLFGENRRQAAENGLCYIHPTYGTVSRYGLIPLASSMDQIGVVCRDLSEGFELLALLAGHDPGDGAMFPEKSFVYKKTEQKPRLAIPSGLAEMADEGARASLCSFASGFETVEVKLPFFELFKQVMYILCSAELSANISRYDGIKFGFRSPGHKNVEELYTKTRTEGFGIDAKLAAVMGSAVLSGGMYAKYYEKAMKLRRLIKESLNFDGYDVLALPVTFGGSAYDDLSLYAAAPLAGLPTVSFSFDGGGVQLIAAVKNEGALLSAREVTL